MAVYLIATLNIHDRDRYKSYEDGFMEIFMNYKGKILSVEEAPVTKEGAWDYTRTVLVEFPSKEEADAWYHSDAYQSLMQHRLAASEGNVVLLNKLELG